MMVCTLYGIKELAIRLDVNFFVSAGGIREVLLIFETHALKIIYW